MLRLAKSLGANQGSSGKKFRTNRSPNRDPFFDNPFTTTSFTTSSFTTSSSTPHTTSWTSSSTPFLDPNQTGSRQHFGFTTSDNQDIADVVGRAVREAMLHVNTPETTSRTTTTSWTTSSGPSAPPAQTTHANPDAPPPPPSTSPPESWAPPPSYEEVTQNK